VRALGLDFLPDGTYLAYCIRLLRTALNIPGSRRRRLVTARAHVDEVHVMLQKAIDLTATIDIPGELGVPLNFVSALQTSARDGLASLPDFATPWTRQ
jgi:hypothetical protein